MYGLRIALGSLALAMFLCFFWMKTLLSDEIEREVFRSIWLYPNKLNEYVKNEAKLCQVRTIRAGWLISFIGLLAVFACMLVTNLRH